MNRLRSKAAQSTTITNSSPSSAPSGSRCTVKSDASARSVSSCRVSSTVAAIVSAISSSGAAIRWQPTTVLSGDVAEEAARLKHLPGKDVVVVGSGELAQTLIGHDLVDQYQLWIHPIVFGSGKRPFRGLETPAPMRLVDSGTTAQGLVILTCERIRPRRADAAAA